MSAYSNISTKNRWWFGFLFATLLLLTGCPSIPTTEKSGPSPEEIAKRQRIERAQANLNEALKQYEIGSYDDATRNFLLALDSGVLTVAEQITARKQMAFIYCINSREASCKEEFEKIFALDPKFELTPAESGHPTWGPIFRVVKTEIMLKKSGRPLTPPALPKQLTTAEKLMAEGLAAYEAADYNKAIKILQDALKEPSITPADTITAYKISAFSYCLTNRAPLCRAEFEKILKINPEYTLEPAEIGHPSWGPSFRAVKAKTSPPKK